MRTRVDIIFNMQTHKRLHIISFNHANTRLSYYCCSYINQPLVSNRFLQALGTLERWN